MDPASLIGLVVAFGAVLASIFLEGSSPMSVVLPAPMMLVIGGTLGAGLLGSTLKDAIFSLTSLPRALTFKPPKSQEAVETLVGLADRARREGLLALEDAIKGVDDEFLRDGLQTAIDGTDPDELFEMLSAKVQQKKAADKQAAKIFGDMGGYAPTIGIIGTVMSLVHVLENLSDAASLGPMISGAFVATLWGVASANVLWLPIQSRLTRLSGLEVAQMELVIEGIVAVQAGANPRSVAKKLESLLPPGTAPSEKAA